MTSYSYVPFENRDARDSNTWPISVQPLPIITAPKSVTGSLCDQMALRGAASPLWSAVSASVRRGRTDPRKSSVSPNVSSLLRNRRSIARRRRASTHGRWPGSSVYDGSRSEDDRLEEHSRTLGHAAILSSDAG